MRIKQTHEFELEVEVTRLANGDAEIVLTKIDSDGGEFHYPREVDDEDYEVLEYLDKDQIPEGWTDAEIIDAYFNSPYGVA